MTHAQPPQPPFIIGIVGGTGSGKTTVAERIVEGIPDGHAVMIQHDWYYRDISDMPLEERARFNFDEPAALDNDLLAEHIRALREGHAVQCPQYDFKGHLRTQETLRVEPRRIIVVEGILLFAVTQLRELFDLGIFIDTADDIRLMRRIKRDILHRGRDIESIQRQYYETVRPMHKQHVEPTRQYAHLIIPEGGENRRAIDVIVGKLLYLLALRA
jgi:uridine kinase